MEGTIHFPGAGEHGMPSKQQIDVFVKAWSEVWQQVPHEERAGILKSIVEDHLSDFLAGMSREERLSLMNGLLPKIASEFPLADIDVLKAFSSPDQDTPDD